MVATELSILMVLNTNQQVSLYSLSIVTGPSIPLMGLSSICYLVLSNKSPSLGFNSGKLGCSS